MLPIILLVIIVFFFLTSEYGWKIGILYATVIGFVQDPIRKLAENQPVYISGLSFLLFVLTFFALKSKFQGWGLRYVLWSNPRMIGLLSIFFYILGFQAVNSFSRFGDIRLTIVGLIFYLLPIFALWVGYQIGCDIRFVRMFILTYLITCSITAISIIFNLWGFENKLLDEVGGGMQVTSVEVKTTGLWRTSEMAAWHLASGSCFAFLLGICEQKLIRQILYFFLSISLAFLSTTTARRKALGMIILFTCIFLLFYIRNFRQSRIMQILLNMVLVLGLSGATYGLVFQGDTQSTVDQSTSRASSLSVGDAQDRFSVQGLAGTLKAIEISGPLGLGIGAGSNTGNTGIDKSKAGVSSLSFASEGGGGRIVTELGVLGSIFFAYMLINAVVLFVRNFKIGVHYLNKDDFSLLVGMLTFVIANAFIFFSAGQLYSDPFVLIIIGLSLGTFLSIPFLAASTSQNISTTK